MVPKVIRIGLHVLGVLGLIHLLLPTAAWMAPDGRHCGGVGPIDPDFCGCTWGAVYYRGQPIADVPVMLGVGGATLAATFNHAARTEPYPFYAVSGSELGAKRGDTMTMTVTLGNVTATRTFRAEPAQSGENQGEQEIALVLPEQGAWQPWLSGGYTRTLLVDDQSIWAGGPAGLLRIDSQTGITAVQSLPWSTPQVSALAQSRSGEQWAAGPHQLARRIGGQWQAVAPPFSASIRALAFDEHGRLWVGGGDTGGALARYDGTWQTVTAIAQPIMTLTVAASAELWAGTWGGGVYRRAAQDGDLNQGWQQIRVVDGLSSDYILSAVGQGADLWFGTRPYTGSQGALGGISHYNSATGQWQRYGTAEGLPAAGDLPQAPARIYALAIDHDGVLWAGTDRGIHLQITPNRWLTDTATTAPVYALATDAALVMATTADGVLHRLDRQVTPGAPPSAAFTRGQGATILRAGQLDLAATAVDQDEGATTTAPQIYGWNWISDRDGPLCTTAGRCTFSAAGLSLGEHQITLRVQDDEGVWSAGISTKITVIEESIATPTPIPTRVPPLPSVTPTIGPTATRAIAGHLYLPLINRGR